MSNSLSPDYLSLGQKDSLFSLEVSKMGSRDTFRNTSLSKKDSIDSGSVSRESRVAGILDSGFSSSMSLNSGENRERVLGLPTMMFSWALITASAPGTEGIVDIVSNAEAGRELEGSRADRGKNNQSEEISCF